MAYKADLAPKFDSMNSPNSLYFKEMKCQDFLLLGRVEVYLENEQVND